MVGSAADWGSSLIPRPASDFASDKSSTLSWLPPKPMLSFRNNTEEEGLYTSTDDDAAPACRWPAEDNDKGVRRSTPVSKGSRDAP